MKKIFAILMIAVLCMTLVSCGSKKADSEYYYEPSYDTGFDSDEYPSSAAYFDDPAAGGWGATSYAPSYNGEAKEDSSSANSSGSGSGSHSATSGLKLTYNGSISVETLEFNKSLEAVMSAIEQAGGFISYRNEGGGYTNTYGSYMKKWMDIECRIPAGNYQSFLDGTSEFGNVTSLKSTMEDITSQYLDTQSRLTSLEAQRDRLTELMRKAETVSDLLEIEYQLSETIYQIENYAARKNTYDDLVAYSTVTISIKEVSVVTPSAETFWDRLIATIGSSLRDFVDFLETLLLGVIYLAPFALVIFGLALLVVRTVKKRRAKKQAKLAEAAAQSVPKEAEKQ